jgi:hypothetical protein
MSAPPQGEQPAATQQATISPPPPEALAHAQKIAGTLGETEEKPIIQIARIVDTLGPEEADAFVAKAQAAFAGEGVLTQDGSRKRNLGGSFFWLVREHVGPKVWRKKIKPVLSQKKALAVDLEKHYAIIQEAASRQNFKAGDTSKVEITLTGTPISVQKQPTFVALSFIDKDPAPPLPKGVPTLLRSSASKAEAPTGDKADGKAEKKTSKGKAETRYLVLVALKQWPKIEEALKKNKNDKVVVKGYSLVQPNFAGIVVLAYQINTIGLLSGGAKRG